VPPIVSGNPHAVTTAGRAAPPACVVLRCVVKEGSAARIRASFYEFEIPVAQQVARGLGDWNQQLIRLVQIETRDLAEMS